MAAEILSGAMLAHAGMEVHRNTVVGALVSSLRLTFPTVAQLLGARFFERVASDYALANPPRQPVLYLYGDGFPDYLRSSPGTRPLTYIWDVARFDLGIERAAHQPVDIQSCPIEIDSSLHIRLASSLSCLQVDYPVDLIRDAAEAGHPSPLATVDLTAGVRHLAIWRGTSGAAVRRLTPIAARFLTALLRGGDATEAMQSASERGTAPAQEVIAAIRGEVLAASFTQLTWHSPSGASR
jgi:hypothetical protein